MFGKEMATLLSSNLFEKSLIFTFWQNCFENVTIVVKLLLRF